MARVQVQKQPIRAGGLEIYVILLLALFPFYNTDRYFSVLSYWADFFLAGGLCDGSEAPY